MCYNMLGKIASALKSESNSPESIRNSLSILQFLFYHEASHALIHSLSLPIIRKEGDAADILSVYLIANSQIMQLKESEWLYLIEILDNKLSVIGFTYEHSIEEERSQNIICLAYGSNPGLYPNLASHLPDGWAGMCRQEYLLMSDSLSFAISIE